MAVVLSGTMARNSNLSPRLGQKGQKCEAVRINGYHNRTEVCLSATGLSDKNSFHALVLFLS